MNISGNTADTGADQRADTRALSVIAVMIVVSLVISAQSAHADLLRIRPDISWRDAWVKEGTSHLVLLALLFLPPRVLDMAPLTDSEKLWRVAAVHFCGYLIFAALHIAGMFSLRAALFPRLVGYDYHYDFLALHNLLYELRKDAFTYGLLVFGFWAFREIEQRRIEAETAVRAARSAGRITFKSGGSTFTTAASDIAWASAGGNYVEVGVAGKTFLARMTLARLERLLGQAGDDHLRVHRSHLVSRRKIARTTPTGEGGVTIELTDGKQVPGSRRYRSALSAALVQSASDPL